MGRIREAATAKARRWRALCVLLWRAGRWRTVGLGVLTLIRGVLPTGLILATGALIGAVPDAVEQGFGSEAGARAIWALVAVGVGFLAIGVTDAVTDYAATALTARYTETVHDTVARSALAPENVAVLEDPDVVGELAALEEYDRTGVHLTAVSHLQTFLTLRLQGLAAMAVIVNFRWWAPLVLLIGARITNWTISRYVEHGVALGHAEGATGLRRGNYLRQLAMGPAAAKEVRVFGLAGWVVGQYADSWLAAMRKIWQARAATRWGLVGGGIAMMTGQAVVIGWLGWTATGGSVSVAALVVFVQAVMAVQNLGPIGDAQWAIGRTVNSAEHVLDLERRFAGTGRQAAAVPSSGEPVEVRLESLRFTYRGRREPTLHDFDLTIPAGQSLAIVGENGVGKTTLIKLLCGLYEPDAGRVLLGGTTDPVAARSRIGVIFQDFVRYELPLSANVGFGSLDLVSDKAKLEAALSDAGGRDLPDLLPAGWDTVLARGYENGSDLSGGQWQKVALARALMAVRGGAGLLILDEPTANLDVRAEAELFDRFLELTKGVTTILVSHRLSSVRHADRIVVIADGHVVEDGSHAELIAAGGRYARMYGLQASRFAEVGSVDGEVADA